MIKYITPKIVGVYSIAEVVDDSNKIPYKTLFFFFTKDGDSEFDKAQIKSLKAVGKMIEDNVALWFKKYSELVEYLNDLER